MPRPSWNRDEIINAVVRFERKHGRLPQNADWRGPDLPAPATMRREFGSQEDCFIAAGCAEAKRRVVSREDVREVLVKAAIAMSDGRRLTTRQYDDFAEAQGLPRWRAISNLLGGGKWSVTLQLSGLIPGSSREVSVGELKRLLLPVAQKWLGSHDHLRGLGTAFESVLKSQGWSLSVVKARMSEDTKRPRTEETEQIVRWLGLIPPESALEKRVIALASHLGRGPNAEEIQEHGLSNVYSHYTSLDELYLELDLKPPSDLYRSTTHLGAYASAFERKVAEVLAEELEAKRINWIAPQWRFNPKHRFTADFLVFLHGRCVIVEADGYGPTDKRKPRFYRSTRRTRLLKEAAQRIGASVLIVCPHQHDVVVGILVSPDRLAQALARSGTREPVPLSAHVELAEAILNKARAFTEPTIPKRLEKLGTKLRAAASLGAVPFWCDEDLAESVIAGRNPTLHLDPEELVRRSHWFARWEEFRPRAIPEIANELSLSPGALRKALPGLVNRGLITEQPGPRGPLYSVEEVKKTLGNRIRELETMPDGFRSMNVVANQLGISRNLACKLAHELGFTRPSATGLCMPVGKLPELRKTLVRHRHEQRVNSSYEKLVPDKMVALGDLGDLAIPGVPLAPKAVASLVAAARINVLDVATSKGRLKVIAAKDVPRIAEVARAQAEAVHGAYEGIPIEVFDSTRHMSLRDLATAASSSARTVPASQVRRYVLTGRLLPTGVHRGQPNWQLHFDRSEAPQILRALGLPVPNDYLTEEAAARSLGVNRCTLQAKVTSNDRVRALLKVHAVYSCGGGKETRYYDPAALMRSLKTGIWDRARLASAVEEDLEPTGKK